MIIQLSFINPCLKDIHKIAGNDTVHTKSFCLGKYSWPLSHTSFDAWTTQVRGVHCLSSQKFLQLCSWFSISAVSHLRIQPTTNCNEAFSIQKIFQKEDPHCSNLCCSSVTCMLVVQAPNNCLVCLQYDAWH